MFNIDLFFKPPLSGDKGGFFCVALCCKLWLCVALCGFVLQNVKIKLHLVLLLPLMKVSKFVDDIAADPKKGLIWIILLTLAIVAVFFAWSKIKGLFKEISNSISARVDNPVEDDKLTHSGAWYKNAADTLFTAMDGWGTDENAIDNIIAQIYNQDDWNALVREYGTRELSQPWWQSPLSGTLQVHLRDDCSSSHINKIRSTLGERGITTGL